MGCQLESDDSCWLLISVPRSLVSCFNTWLRCLAAHARTGVAFASVEARATNYPHSNKIEVVRNWGRAMGNMDKVPSVISYSSPGEPEWGSNISGDALTLINQKLELELQEKRVDELGLTLRVLNGTRGLSFDHIRDAGPNPDFPCSTPEQIVADYLRQVFQCTRDAIKVKELGRTSTPVDLVITMPVVSTALVYLWPLLMLQDRPGRIKHGMPYFEQPQQPDSILQAFHHCVKPSWFPSLKQQLTTQPANVEPACSRLFHLSRA